MSDAKPTPPKADQAKPDVPTVTPPDVPENDAVFELATETEPEGGWIVDFDGNRIPRCVYDD